MKYLLFLPIILTTFCHAQPHAPGIPDLESGTVPEFARTRDAHLSPTTHAGRGALRIDFGTEAPWPHVIFEATPEPWDWQHHAGIRIGLFNPADQAVSVNLRVDNAGANGTDHCNTKQQRVGPGESAELTLYFNTRDRERFWGMRGIPVRGPMGTGAPLDLARITAWQLFLNRPEGPRSLLLTGVELFGEGGDLAEKVPFPFIDAYGQYKHTDWPGKVASDAALQAAHQRDREARAADAMPDRDPYGGWTEGPKLDATGWFRTARVDGQWWLVTPDGHLFFSAGADCVGTWSQTFIERRGDWFEWLPDADSERFKPAFGYAKNAHSMAEPINGEGRTFGFYTANLIRIFGPDWKAQWREHTLARLRAWGFNTLGNWSQWDVMREGDLPFVANLGISDVPRIEAATGYWAKMMDVYDPAFAPAVEKAVQGAASHWRDNNRCIGYFVDNELAWEGVVDGVLKSGPDQPARKAFLTVLQDRHESIEALNTAWDTAFEDWAAIAPPGDRNEAVQKDLDAYLYTFAATYFRTIQEAFERHAPNQLYLGARFSSAPEPAVRACAAHADVVSFNVYARGLNEQRSELFASLEKPVIIGEFHFGATDRGMFHPGLVPVADQAERGTAYARYVKSLLDHPAVVGAHWFQYVDEPVTGRYYDGENYNIGLVDVTDRPYTPLVEAAADVHRAMYSRRHSTTGGADR